MKKHLILVLIFASIFTCSWTQSSSVFVMGLSFPGGDFAEDDYYDAIFDGAGYAGTGIYLGLKFYSPTRREGLSSMYSFGVMYNPLQRDFKDEFEDDWDVDVNYPRYINIPILGGVNYSYPISDEYALFGEAGLGGNILWLTNFKYKEDRQYEAANKFSPSLKLGFSIGGGIVIKDKYTINLNYLGLGSHKSKYKYEERWFGIKESGKDKFDRSLDVRAFTLTFGWIL